MQLAELPQSVRLKIRVVAPEEKLPSSPISASIAKMDVDPQVSEDEETEFRGVIELRLLEHLSDVMNGTAGLGHVVLSSDLGEATSRFEFDRRLGALVSYECRNEERFRNIGQIDESIYSSEEFSDFIEAFKSLKLADAIDKQQSFASQPGLISKIDLFRHFQSISTGDWQSLVTHYLRSYEKLIQYADQQDSDWIKFWARHPFSVSTWTTSVDGARIANVMISPFHPLRLAWLTSVESVLRTADGKWTSFLAGGISGWQFPYFSVSRHAAGRLIALPLDGGRESLFAGWSMLVPVQVDGHRSLVVPQLAGDLAMPGVASDGLSANSVAGASEKFFELHPFMSTVTADLTARSKTPKSDAVDTGVIKAINNWRTARAARGLSPGGAKVYDNVNRDGSIGSDISSLGGEHGEKRSSFSWIRYEGENPAQRVNIRVLGDSGLNYLAGNSNSGVRTGSVGIGLLRRFEVVGARVDGFGAYVEPSLLTSEVNDPIGQAFFDCLRIHERMPGQNDVSDSRSDNTNDSSGMRFEVQAGKSSVSGADWIIGGDSSLPPTLLSRMLRNQYSSTQHDLTIWDWHPPMFGSSNTEVVGSIDLRPYVVISKLTEAFKGRLDAVLTSSDPSLARDVAALATIRSEVLETLGSSGIGISSLFANHKLRNPQRGAMGFWMALDLLSQVNEVNREIIAVPLDKVDRLLEALSGRKIEDRRRADLLLIELTEHSVRLAPVEVKFLKLDNPSPELVDPLGNDDELASAFEQVFVTKTRLAEIVDQLKVEEISDRSNSILRWNAFATLIDIGIRLSPSLSNDAVRRRRVARWLQKISVSSNGLSLELGNPLVAYFQAHNGAIRQYYGQPIGRGNAVLFQTDPRDLMKERNLTGQTFIDFTQVVDLIFPPSVDAVDLLETNIGDGKPIRRVLPELQGIDEVDISNLDSETDSSGDHKNATEAVDVNGIETPVEVELKEDLTDAHVNAPESNSVPNTEDDDGVRILVGNSIDGGSDVYFWPGNTSLGNPNVGIVGEMGSGKTQLCLSLVALLRKAASDSQASPLSGLILDPKGDYSRADRQDFYAAAGVKVLQPTSLPIELISIQDGDSQQAIALKVSAFVDIFGRVLGRDFGPVQRERLREAVRGVIELRQRSPLVSEIHAAYKLLVGTKRDTVTSRLGELVDLQIFTNDPSELVSINTLLRDGVVVLNLEGLFNHVSIQEQLMAIFVNQFQSALRSQTKWPIRVNSSGASIRTLNLFLLIDEASMVIRHEYPQLEDILRTGREYGVMTIMSSQFLGDFESDQIDYGQSLRTWFVHQQSQVSKKELSDLGLPDSQQVMDALRQLATHQCLYSTHPGPVVFARGRPWHEVSPSFEK
jgi:DNA phosphorothioation-dependent restriction protein DptH